MMQSPPTAPANRNGAFTQATGWPRSVLELIGSELQCLEEFRPRVCLLLATLFAVTGYACLLLFPALVFAGISGLEETLHGNAAVIWSQVLAWSAVVAVSLLVSYRVFSFVPALPGGTPLAREAAPSLFDLVATLSRHYSGIRIHRIVLSAGFELRIVKTPLWGLPVWSTTTLVVGRPLIECLPPSRFQCALARRLGQHSKRYNRLGNWLYELREIWPRYCAREQPAGFGFQPVTWLFRVYAPLYRVISLPAARIDELVADNYAMELFNDAEVLDTITTEMVCRTYLAEKFWPVIRRIAASERQAMTGFHAGMVSVLRTGLQDGKPAGWIARILSADPRWDDPLPSLARRVENIGHRDARMESLDGETAASIYLGNVRDKRLGSRGIGTDRETGQAEWLHLHWRQVMEFVTRKTDRLRKRHRDAAAVPGE